MPPVPPAGWERAADSQHGWFAENWEIRDHNADGQVDYIRIQDPPDSYNHRIWIDRDYDGYFDEYSDAAGTARIEINLLVPEFKPLRGRQQPDAGGSNATELDGGNQVRIRPSTHNHQQVAAAIKDLLETGQLENFEGLRIEATDEGRTRISFDRFTAPDGTYVENAEIVLD